MAKNTTTKADTATRANALKVPTTQRAYTLRLHGVDPNDNSWRDALWATHEAVNKGARVFGDWLLTLRGGLSHDLAEPPPQAKGKKRSDDENAALRKRRRILLALSWLSVEDERGAPTEQDFLVASGKESDSVRRDKVLTALRSILEKRGVGEQTVDEWIEDCKDSLSASVREDAVWVNRSAAFDEARDKIGSSLTRDEVWDILEPFFGTRESYLASVDLEKEDDSGAEEKAKDLVQKAGQWLSSRFGTGSGADFKSMAEVYDAMVIWAENAGSFRSGAAALADLGNALARFKPKSRNADGILGLISGPGYKSATRNIVKSWSDHTGGVSRENLKKFAETAEKDKAKCEGNIGGKGRRPWSDKALASVESACGFTYLQKDGPARHSEFTVMLDHAARRVSIAHSWIKRAEAERRRFEADAKRLDTVPDKAAAWLDAFVQERSGSVGGEYRIRRRAIEGWDDVLKRWGRADCKTADDRIAAAREVQADPEIEKFGDIQLFEALAADDAQCVWRLNGKVDPSPLRDYVLGHDASFRKRRFKVPAYRHPDPLRHPVFCEFGNSRWSIEYSAHKAHSKLGKVRDTVKKKKESLDKTCAQLKKARSAARPNPERIARLEARIATIRDDLQNAQKEADRLASHRGVRMRLWDGNDTVLHDLKWSSKRLVADLAIDVQHTSHPTGVTRADRLGSSASGATGDVAILNVFDEKHWNSRLQAPRAELDRIARLEDKGETRRAESLKRRLRWLITFSPRMLPYGPFIDYAARFADDAPARPVVSYNGEYIITHADSDKRKGHAMLILSRLPGLRVLSVDLGHRFAAACAVWETLSITDFKKEVEGCDIAAGGSGEHDLYLHTLHTDVRGKQRKTIYRRIGPDVLSDGKQHPAPWARLDRQFLIKLQGEEMPARAALPAEMEFVRRLEADLGRSRDANNPLPRRVDELMSEAVRSLRLGLARHARRAKIAWALDPATRSVLGMGGAETAFRPGDENHVKLLVNALFDWHSLASDHKWSDDAARGLWNKHIVPLDDAWEINPPHLNADNRDNITRQQRRKDDETLRKRLKPIAQSLAASDRAQIHKAWCERWQRDDGMPADRSRGAPATGWHARLRQVHDWIVGRRCPGSDAPSHSWKKHVGGLSLTRLSTMRSLYRLHKSFAMRPRPDKPRGAPEKGETNAGVAKSLLDAMERMREQRVKQLASRIVEAALGVGRMKPAAGRDRKRPRSRVDEPCHAVVIESLRHYRPDELRTRRENRALMNWSASKVRKRLEEACQLYGLYLREVPASYTSRQCSRTGLPGVRCADVPVTEFLSAPWWSKAISAAKKKIDGRSTNAEARLLVDLHEKWSAANPHDRQGCTVRVPRNGGDLFVAAPPRRCASSRGSNDAATSALQADLNAAANIGLRALLDPDFWGRWWYVLCDAATGKPARDKYAGSACIDLDKQLLPPQAKADSAVRKRGRKGGGDRINAWRDVAAENGLDPAKGWQVHTAYWNDVKARVVSALRRVNGLPIPEDASSADLASQAGRG